MSELYRSALSARIANLPPPAFLDGEEDDEESEAADSIGPLAGIGMGPPPMPAKKPRASTGRRVHKPAPNPEFAPLSASSYFENAVQVSLPSRSLDSRVYYTPPTYADGAVMVCHHGAGYSGLSFACFAREVKELTKGECGVLALDARRHGKSLSTVEINSSSVEDENLSIDVLVADFTELIRVVFPDPSKAPSLLLIGHSMGGSVVVHGCPILLQHKYRIAGVAVIDVVEGSAIEALPHMHNLLNARPEGFESVEEAVEWHVSTKTIRNPTSARISIPPIIIPNTDSAAVFPHKWRTPLRSTAPYWLSWFQGLSSMFLAAKTARILVLAGTERLDKELMIGQMQGKFQVVVLPGVGHMLHEDDPTRFAEVMVEFWRRNEKVIVGVKKVGDL